MKLRNETYDVLKWIAQIVLPAAGTLYFALSTIWGLPFGEQVVGTITAVDAFLGALLGLSAQKYIKSDDFGDGTLKIDMTDPEKDTYRLDFNTPLDQVPKKKTVSFKVDKNAKL